MDDLNEHLQEVFGGGEEQAPTADVARCIRCEDSIPNRRRKFCDRCKGENRRSQEHRWQAQYREKKRQHWDNFSRAVLAVVTEGGGDEPSDIPPDEVRPKWKDEITRPHSQHVRPVFGCYECRKRAFAQPDPLLRNSR